MTLKKLNRSGGLVQQAYLEKCLKLVHEFGTLRMISIAFAMFPARTPSAAQAAAQRMVTNAFRLGYLAYLTAPDSRRYYALTREGASMLNALDDSYCYRSTAGVGALRLKNREHREWCNIIAIASTHRKLVSKSESQISGPAYTEIIQYFDHAPDAVTYYDEDGQHFAAWHEVELSRRSTSGTKKLTHLVRTLIEKRYITHDNLEHDINLMMHCATPKIERENHKVIRAALVDCCVLNENMHLQEAEEEHQSPSFALQISAVNRPVRWFMVYINLLPASVERTWNSSIPWPGAPGTPTSDVDVYLVSD